MQCIEALEKESTVQRVRVDMCQFGMVSRTGNAGSSLEANRYVDKLAIPRERVKPKMLRRS